MWCPVELLTSGARVSAPDAVEVQASVAVSTLTPCAKARNQSDKLSIIRESVRFGNAMVFVHCSRHPEGAALAFGRRHCDQAVRRILVASLAEYGDAVRPRQGVSLSAHW